MKKLLCALLIALPIMSQANPEMPMDLDLHLKYTQQVSEMDSYINREVEALAIKSAYSAQHPDILKHQRNIQNASDHKRMLATNYKNGTIKLCKQVFN